MSGFKPWRTSLYKEDFLVSTILANFSLSFKEPEEYGKMPFDWKNVGVKNNNKIARRFFRKTQIVLFDTLESKLMLLQ